MKITFGVVLVVLLAMAVQADRRCPKSRPGCVCTREYEPVCSREGCTYSNACLLACAGADFWYYGACKDRHIFG